MPDSQSTAIAGATETAPFDEGGTEIANSGVILNTDEHRAAEVTIVVSDLTPNADSSLVGYKIRVQLEERVAESPNEFVVRGVSDEWNAGFKKVHVISLRPGAVTNPGVPETMDVGGVPTLTMYVDGVLPPAYRIRLMQRITNATRDDLDSITFVAYLKTYHLVPE